MRRPEVNDPGETVGGSMLVVTRHRPVEPAAFLEQASGALAALAAQTGCESAEVLCDLDEGAEYVIVTRWRDVGSYRRALSSFDVKVAAVGLLATALDQPSAFEARLTAEPGTGAVRAAAGDRAPDADTAGPQ
ncbi:MAG: antibiotic biosynthesis monooxygenase family protein [Candidatus Nanopelagicales bacterium]